MKGLFLSEIRLKNQLSPTKVMKNCCVSMSEDDSFTSDSRVSVAERHHHQRMINNNCPTRLPEAAPVKAASGGHKSGVVMNTICTVTVNPSASPTGSRNPELMRFLMRRRLLRQGALLARREAGVRLFRSLFGSTSVNVALSVMLLAVRLVCGAWLVAEGVTAGHSILTGILIFAGVAVAAGCLCRLIMAVASGVAAYVILGGVSVGMVDLCQPMLLFTTLLLTFAGPGRYSLDSVVNMRVFRAACRRETRRLFSRRFSFRSNNLRK